MRSYRAIQVYFKYPYRKVKAQGIIVVATTRPETMLGDMAVAVNPADKRYAALNRQARWSCRSSGREIPIVADEHADPEQGTGAVKITPAHDFNDFEVGRRHNLELVNIFEQAGKIRQVQRSTDAASCNSC